MKTVNINVSAIDTTADGSYVRSLCTHKNDLTVIWSYIIGRFSNKIL